MGKYIYLISLLKAIRISGFVILVTCIFYSLIVLLLSIEIDEDDRVLFLKKAFKNKFITMVIIYSLIAMIFIPSKKDMYSMVIVDKVLTQENYNKSIDEVKKLIDYTIKKINGVKGE